MSEPSSPHQLHPRHGPAAAPGANAHRRRAGRRVRHPRRGASVFQELSSPMRHFLDLLDLNPDELTHLLRETGRLKEAHRQGQRESFLANRVLGMIFEKPSLRTRASFEAAMAQMGGSAIFMNGSDAGMGKRESVPDFARTMSAYVDAVVLRTFSHQTIVEFARWSGVPVINGLSDYYHPCQALADLFTMWEVFGEVRGKTLVFVGDGNNVARSVAVCCGKL